MTLRDRCRSVASATIVLTAVLMLGGCPQQAPPATFTAISEHGFDAADTAQDINDYPWAMVHFTPDGASTGRLFVATGNSVDAVWQQLMPGYERPSATLSQP